MAVQRMFTLDEYEHMIAAGIFPPEDRSELIRGEIIEMAPIGLRHAACVTRIQTLFSERLGRAAIVSVQNPIRLTGNSLPQPDLVLLRPRSDFYGQSRPTAGDVLLLVEVSDSTLEYDTNVKIPLYAEASIQEVWIVNLQDNLITAYSNPLAKSYTTVQLARKSGKLFPFFNPDLVLDTDDILA